MISHPPLELRLEIYAEPNIEAAVADRIGAALRERWPVSWDVKLPPQTNADHPARWHAIVPRAESETPQGLHREIVKLLHGIEPSGTLHFRTRWDFPQSPNEQEIFEEGWR